VPTYQYACSACQHEFEVFQAFSDSSLTHCPECNGKLNKVYSAVGVVFKGSGFYKTDSKSESKPANRQVQKVLRHPNPPTEKLAVVRWLVRLDLFFSTRFLIFFVARIALI
jgi:putative FmdB family regulatory protein